MDNGIIQAGELMFHETPVLQFDFDNETLSVVSNYLPYVLKQEPTLPKLMYWLENRLPPKMRGDFLEACRQLGIHSNDTVSWQELNYCLHVDDDFWVRPIGSDIKRSEIDSRVQLS